MHPLVTPQDLAVELERERDADREAGSVVLLDVRWTLGGPPGLEAYLRGHLPDARFVDLEAVLSDPVRPDRSGGRHPLPSPERFEAGMRAAGVGEASRVVVYDEDGGFAAARAWWCLRYFGHADTRFLDGGFQAWTSAGLAVRAGEPPAPAVPGDLVAVPGGMPTLDAESAARLARDGILLDARAAERFEGRNETIDPVAGHIPGARSAPTVANALAGKGFRPVEELRARFAELGVDGSRPVGAYCGSGVSAAHEVLALELAGVPAALYVGSWSDWTSDPERPVATGPTS